MIHVLLFILQRSCLECSIMAMSCQAKARARGGPFMLACLTRHSPATLNPVTWKQMALVRGPHQYEHMR